MFVVKFMYRELARPQVIIFYFPDRIHRTPYCIFRLEDRRQNRDDVCVCILSPVVVRTLPRALIDSFNLSWEPLPPWKRCM